MVKVLSLFYLKEIDRYRFMISIVRLSVIVNPGLDCIIIFSMWFMLIDNWLPVDKYICGSYWMRQSWNWYIFCGSVPNRLVLTKKLCRCQTSIVLFQIFLTKLVTNWQNYQFHNNVVTLMDKTLLKTARQNEEKW